jgi:paraquat-inducible protein B
MSKMANKSLIGAFVIGAIALAVIAVIVFGSGKFFKRQLEFITFFQGSIKGLSVGSPVIFRGVKIGEVKDISIQARPSDLAFNIPVILEVDPSRIQSGEPGVKFGEKRYQHFQALIDKGMRAQLTSQSFVTGQLAVAFDFFPDKPAKLVGLDKKYHEIPSVPTPIEELQKTIEDLNLKEFGEKVKSTLDGVERAVNSPEIQKTLKSISAAAEEVRVMVKTVNSQVGPLASNANETVKDVQKLVQNLDRQITTLLPSIEGTMKDAQKLAQHIDGRIDPIAMNAEETLKGVNGLVNNDVKKLVGNLDQRVEQVMPEIAKTLETMRGTLQEAQVALRSVGSATGGQSPLIYQLTATMEELSNTARSLRSLTDYIEQHPDSFIWGK